MKLVLLCGGSGKRLWPLSNNSRSKPFIKVLKNQDDEMESMVQRVWRQLQSVGLAERTWISTGKGHIEIINNQLGNGMQLIEEPFCKDTFPAIALASSYLYSELGMDENEVVCILPVDTYAEDPFFEKLKELEQVIIESNADLALMGTSPSYPSEKYGYIIPDEAHRDQLYSNVSHFVEKPSAVEAERLMRQEALWNCGVFAFRLKYMISIMENRGMPLRFHQLCKEYESLSPTSFDYEVVEKAKRIVVLPHTGEWKDIGTWNSLTEEIEPSLLGKGIISKDSVNSHLINELNIPVAVVGLSNVVVAASPDGILVANKSSSTEIKRMMQTYHERPYYEERRWGTYRVLDYTTLEDGNKVLTKRVRVNAGKNLSYQVHHKRCEVWTIISGEGEFVLDEEWFMVKPGDILKISAGAKHGIKAIIDLEFIEIQTGSQLVEEDIDRICMTWEEVREKVWRRSHLIQLI